MRKLLRLPIKRAPLTDEEYVEHVRDGLRAANRWLDATLGAAGLVLAYAMISLAQIVGQRLPHPPGGTATQNLLNRILGISVLFGVCAGFCLIRAGRSFASAVLDDRRMENLLLKYHDHLKELGELEQPSPDKAESQEEADDSERNHSSSAKTKGLTSRWTEALGSSDV